MAPKFKICNDRGVVLAIRAACIASQGNFVSATFVLRDDTLIIAFRNPNNIPLGHPGYVNAINTLRNTLPEEYRGRFTVWTVHKFNKDVPVDIIGKTGIHRKK